MKAGYSSVNVTDMLEFWQSLEEEEKQRIQKLEIFDELEEFNILMEHYCLVSAS